MEFETQYRNQNIGREGFDRIVGTIKQIDSLQNFLMAPTDEDVELMTRLSSCIVFTNVLA